MSKYSEFKGGVEGVDYMSPSEVREYFKNHQPIPSKPVTKKQAPSTSL